MGLIFLLLLFCTPANAEDDIGGISFAMSSVKVEPKDPPEFYTMQEATTFAYSHIGDQPLAIGLRNRVYADVKMVARLKSWKFNTEQETADALKLAQKILDNIPFYRRALKIVDPENLGCSVHSYSIPWEGKKDEI